MLVEKGRDIIAEQYLRCKTSKKTLFAGNDEPPSKNKSLNDREPDKQACETIKITITDKNTTEILNVEPFIKDLVIAMCHNKTDSFFKKLMQIFGNDFFVFAKSLVLKKISDEVNSMLSTKKETSFRIDDICELDKVSYNQQYQELLSSAPILLEVLSTCAINPRAENRNVYKKDNFYPTIVNVAGSLFFCRNQKLNAVASKNMIILRDGHADKTCINRFQKLHMSMSHQSMLVKQEEMGKGFSKPVEDFADSLKADSLSIQQYIKSIIDEEQTKLPIAIEKVSCGTTTYLASNLSDTSFFSKNAVNASVRFANPNSSLDSMEDEGTVSSIELSKLSSNFLSYDDLMPNNIENSIKNMTNSQTDFQMIPVERGEKSQTDFEPCLPSKFVFVGDNLDIHTKRRHYTTEKSNVDRHLYNIIAVRNHVSIPHSLIGIKATRFEDPTDIPIDFFLPTPNDDMKLKEEFSYILMRILAKYVKHLSWAKKYVKHHIDHEYSKEVSEKSEVIPLGILDQKETTAEGMIEILKFQHNLVPRHETSNIVRTLSFGDLLTVERQQNSQEHRRDSSTPSARQEGLVPCLADFHTFGNFLEVIWHLLYDTSSSADVGTLFQARNFLNARSVPASPMKDITTRLVNQKDDLANENLIDETMSNLIDKFVFPKIQEHLNFKSSYACTFCGKSYKRRKSLKKHISEKHYHEEPASSSNCDGVLNYSKNALFLCLLTKDFIDARKHGDGARLRRLHKYLLLFFKLDGRTKYAYQTLHFLAQTSYLLPPSLAHEVIWNRFVNTRGYFDSNVELDRHLEHKNKIAKNNIRSFQGKITQKSIDRSSRSYHKMNAVLEQIDLEIGLSSASRKNKAPDNMKDVLKLAEQFKSYEIFQNKPGRFHSRFPGSPQNFAADIDVLELKRWIHKKCDEFNGMNIYRLDDIVT